MRGRVSARKALLVLAVAEARGVSRGELLAAAGLVADDVADPEARIGQEHWRRLWQEAVAHTGDPDLGLEAAAGIDRGYFGVIDYAARTAPTLREALPLAVRYFRLANTWGRLRVVHDGGLIRVERHIQGDEAGRLPRQAADFALTTMVRVFRSAVRGPLPLERVELRHAEPEDASAYARILGCPARFLCPSDAVVVPERVLDLPMADPDPYLHRVVTAHAEASLAELGDDRDTAGRVRAQLGRDLVGGAPGIDEVARALGTSRRSLQRALDAEGTTYSAVLEGLRRDLAVRWLGTGLGLGEIAFLLGYAEVAPFSRAFRGWFGEAPGAFRQRSGTGGHGAGARAG